LLERELITHCWYSTRYGAGSYRYKYVALGAEFPQYADIFGIGGATFDQADVTSANLFDIR
jgi:hypothetical protein